MSDEHIRKMIKSMREHVAQTDLAWLSTYDQAQALYTCYTDYRALAHYSITGIAQAAKKLRDGGDPAPDMLDLIISIDDIQQAIEDELRKHVND